MAQRSLPQAGDGVGDAGPFTSDEWAEYFQIVYTGDQEATQGPLIQYLNELVVSKAGLTITTGTGAGFVYGHFLVNDAALDIAVAQAAAGQERYDRVVMLENNTNLAYTLNLAPPAGVPRNSARIVILQGAEAGAAVLPDLITGVGGIYMVELARYLVDEAAVGTIDDRRAFCEFSHELPNRTREFFVQPVGGWNTNTASFIPIGYITQDIFGSVLSNGATCSARGHTIVPVDYVSGLTSTGVLRHVAGGVSNVMVQNEMHTTFCDEYWAEHYTIVGPQAVATAGNGNYSCLMELDAPVETEPGEFLHLCFTRFGSSGSDTLGNDMIFFGWLISYTADG